MEEWAFHRVIDNRLNEVGTVASVVNVLGIVAHVKVSPLAAGDPLFPKNHPSSSLLSPLPPLFAIIIRA